jgi:hypothetical protein
MLEHHGTSRSLYRYYANAATASLANGDVILGERLLDIALEICPDYDFAHREKARIQTANSAIRLFSGSVMS